MFLAEPMVGTNRDANQSESEFLRAIDPKLANDATRVTHLFVGVIGVCPVAALGAHTLMTSISGLSTMGTTLLTTVGSKWLAHRVQASRLTGCVP